MELKQKFSYWINNMYPYLLIFYPNTGKIETLNVTCIYYSLLLVLINLYTLFVFNY